MKYDVVIIGGGAAGSVLASRLAANPKISVLLLEAGPDYPDPTRLPDDIKFGHTRFAEAPDSKHNWTLRGTITEEQGEIHVAQGKVIGGGSSINGQAMQRGFPEDFDAWAALGHEEWSYAKVLPYFIKSEHDLDVLDDFHVSLSRLNHWLPRGQAHPEVGQGTAEFHHQIADTLLPQPDPIFHNATALHTAVDMLDPQAAMEQRLVRHVLLPRELLAAWLLGRHEDHHLRERERQEAQIL